MVAVKRFKWMGRKGQMDYHFRILLHFRKRRIVDLKYVSLTLKHSRFILVNKRIIIKMASKSYLMILWLSIIFSLEAAGKTYLHHLHKIKKSMTRIMIFHANSKLNKSSKKCKQWTYIRVI